MDMSLSKLRGIMKEQGSLVSMGLQRVRRNRAIEQKPLATGLENII